MSTQAATGGVAATAGTTAPDPRAQLVERDGQVLLAGGRCRACRDRTPYLVPRCPVCGEETDPADMGPGGTVFSGTVLRIGVPGRRPPMVLAYVDVDDGPRILAHVNGSDQAPAPMARVRLVGQTPDGDPLVSEAPDAASPASPGGAS